MSIDWNEWRARYRTMTHKEHRDFYSRVYQEYPNQQHYNIKSAERFFENDFFPARRVLEIGGWRGELADKILSSGAGIWLWHNAEICDEARTGSVCKNPKYAAVSDIPVEIQYTDLFMSHSVEHMLLHEFIFIVSSFQFDRIYLDAPLGNGPPDWNNYPGTHIIEVGWDGISEALARLRYNPSWSEDHGSSVVRVYERI